MAIIVDTSTTLPRRVKHPQEYKIVIIEDVHDRKDALIEWAERQRKNSIRLVIDDRSITLSYVACGANAGDFLKSAIPLPDHLRKSGRPHRICDCRDAPGDRCKLPNGERTARINALIAEWQSKGTSK